MDNMLSFEERVANLIILCSGQYGAIAHEIAETVGHFSKIGFLDDNDRAGLAIRKIKDIGKFAVEYGSAIPAIGDPDYYIIAPWNKVDAGTVVSTDKQSEMNKGIIWFDSNREKSETASDAVC